MLLKINDDRLRVGRGPLYWLESPVRMSPACTLSIGITQVMTLKGTTWHGDTRAYYTGNTLGLPDTSTGNTLGLPDTTILKYVSWHWCIIVSVSMVVVLRTNAHDNITIFNIFGSFMSIKSFQHDTNDPRE